MKGVKSLQIEIPEEVVSQHRVNDPLIISNRSEAKNLSMHSGKLQTP